MSSIDGSADPDDPNKRNRMRDRKEKEVADDVAHQMFYDRDSTYSGSPAALAHLRARRNR